MIRYYKKIFCLILGITASQPAYGCIVTLFNDSPAVIMIVNHNDKNNKKAPAALISVSKGRSRRIGKATEHAHFTVYTKQPKGNVFLSTYEVQQNECTNNGNPHIKFSDLNNGTGDAHLFTITKTGHRHTSMVRQLPSMQRADIYKEERVSGCSSCLGK